MKCSVRSFVITSPSTATVITQDTRRRRRHVTGSYDLSFAPGTERKIARHLGCMVVARAKPREPEPYQSLVGGSI